MSRLSATLQIRFFISAATIFLINIQQYPRVWGAWKWQYETVHFHQIRSTSNARLVLYSKLNGNNDDDGDDRDNKKKINEQAVVHVPKFMIFLVF